MSPTEALERTLLATVIGDWNRRCPEPVFSGGQRQRHLEFKASHFPGFWGIVFFLVLYCFGMSFLVNFNFVIWVVHRAVLRFAPANPFCYVFGVAFAGSGLSMIASLALHGMTGAGVEPFVALGLMMGFGEAFLTGMLVTILVVYHRDWVATFDDARWLAPRA